MKIYLVAPVFDEEDAIPNFYQGVSKELTAYEAKIPSINDVSKHATKGITTALSVSYLPVKALSSTQNLRKNPALLADFDHATSDAVGLIKADRLGQIDVISQVIKRWDAGTRTCLYQLPEAVPFSKYAARGMCSALSPNCGRNSNYIYQECYTISSNLQSGLAI